MVKTFSRRRILAGLGLLTGGFISGCDRALAAVTPSTAEGPFYPAPSMRLSDIDNDLVKIDTQVTEAGGDIITLKGRLTDKGGHALAGYRIEIWQCDMNGVYMHPGDRGRQPHDAAFQGFGHDITNSEGEYRFRTIKPARYPGRSPHIHVKVLKDGDEMLTTQFYIKDLPDNAQDLLFRRMSKKQADLVSMTFDETAHGLETTVNIIL